MDQSPQTIETDGGRATAWLSEGLESLIRDLAGRPDPSPDEFDFDVVIVGSGYGGAVALSRLAGYADQDRPLRICMLERGQEYLPGMFPSGFADLAGHVRFDSSARSRSSGVPGGLFDVKTGPDVHALVANGLGGGSLINAGVMAWPVDDVFAGEAWPEEIRRDRDRLKQLAESMKKELGATTAPTDLLKVEAMRRLGGAKRATTLDVTVARSAGANAEGVEMRACIGCGDCFTGCNHRAKYSLDVSLLVAGRRKEGVRIHTGASVLRLEAVAGTGWRLEVVHTDEKKRRREAPFWLRSRFVILCAGTFGSTEILMRSGNAGLSFSKSLGERFSANGDSLAEIYGSKFETKAVANELVAPRDREVGPTITTMIDRRYGDPASDVVVQDITVPAAMRRAFEELSITANSLQLLGEADDSRHSRRRPPRDPNAVDGEATKHSLLVALIGRDDASGKLVMTEPKEDGQSKGDGKLWVSWPKLRDDPRFADRQRILEQLANPKDSKSGIGGRVLANPMWRALPEKVTGILDAPLGPQLTVHPLGGCVMAANGSMGVVDHLGRVYSGPGSEVHAGLVVMDGAVVPTSLGINPALTIATLADRAIRKLRDEVWGLKPAAVATPGAGLALPRPFFREVPVDSALTPRPTLVQISERLRGSLKLDVGAGRKQYNVELELWSQPTELATLMAGNGPRCLQLDSRQSELRIFDTTTLTVLGRPENDAALHRMSVHGELRLLGFDDSTSIVRALRGGWAWLRNRGLRDIAQALFDKPANKKGDVQTLTSLLDRVRMLYAIATRAGAKRLLEYDLELKPSFAEPEDSVATLAGSVRGHKTLTYCFAGNPWTQLQQIRITRFPGWIDEGGEPPLLEFDLTFSERSKMSLMKLVDQQDMPSALADLGSFALYLLRTLLHVHVWTFRQPDPSPVREPKLLPGPLPNLPEPQYEFLELGKLPNGKPVRARLTRYRPALDSAQPPVVLIHGYSASGTTFAHEAIPEYGLAAHLCRKGRDVWVLDLRSSCGMPTARERWTFEEVGYSDIPVAVERVLQSTGQSHVDIVAHCMGAAMLSMALLGGYPSATDASEPHLRERQLLPSRIRRLVLSQVGPALVMAPENVFRAYLMRYIRHYLPLADYSFNTSAKPSQGDAMLDRVLASIPYPEDEFRLENPLWPLGARTPWVATRHRMDALYGRTFKLSNIPAALLDRIDDFFGPLNLDTVAQVIHFAKGYAITDAQGVGRFKDAQIVADRLRFKMLTLHSGENGLVHPHTAEAMHRFLGVASGEWQVASPDSAPFSTLGHQDSLIGKTSPLVFKKISEFLEE